MYHILFRLNKLIRGQNPGCILLRLDPKELLNSSH